MFEKYALRLVAVEQSLNESVPSSVAQLNLGVPHFFE